MKRKNKIKGFGNGHFIRETQCKDCAESFSFLTATQALLFSISRLSPVISPTFISPPTRKRSSYYCWVLLTPAVKMLACLDACHLPDRRGRDYRERL